MFVFISEALPCRDQSGAEALAVLNPPNHTRNRARKGTNNPPTSMFVVSQSYMVLISTQTDGCTLSLVLGGECNRAGFTPLGYPPRHRYQDRCKPPPHTTYPWGRMQSILGVLNYSFSGLVRTRQKSRSGVSLLIFHFPFLISVGLKLRDCEFRWFWTHTIWLVLLVWGEGLILPFKHARGPTHTNLCRRSVARCACYSIVLLWYY